MKICIMLLCLLLLVGCGDKTLSKNNEAASTSDTLLVSVEPPLEKEPERVFVSPLSQEDYLPESTYSDPREGEIEYVVLHFTSAVVLSRDDPYNMKLIRKIFEDNELSVHYIIDRDGRAYCYVPENRSAWHAGRGSYNGIENTMNHHSVGIELVAIGSENDMAQYLTSAEYQALDRSLIGFTDAQYETLSALVLDICERNGITPDREHIIGHSEYNGAKSDPGELFSFERILNS